MLSEQYVQSDVSHIADGNSTWIEVLITSTVASLEPKQGFRMDGSNIWVRFH